MQLRFTDELSCLADQENEFYDSLPFTNKSTLESSPSLTYLLFFEGEI
jgi:hypothetical protein